MPLPLPPCPFPPSPPPSPSLSLPVLISYSLQVFRCLPNDAITTFDELRSYRSEDCMAKTDRTQAKLLLTKVKGHLVLFPLNFLSGENLIDRLKMVEKVVPMRFWT